MTQKKIRLQEILSKNGGVKSSDTNTDLSNQIFIMGDSIIKRVRGYELSRKMENCKVYVKSFSGANVMCMEDLLKPTLREMPTHIILHVKTNDVLTKKSLEQIAENIVNLAIKHKRNCDVSISGITARNDPYQKKAADVNRELKCRKEIAVLRSW